MRTGEQDRPRRIRQIRHALQLHRSARRRLTLAAVDLGLAVDVRHARILLPWRPSHAQEGCGLANSVGGREVLRKDAKRMGFVRRAADELCLPKWRQLRGLRRPYSPELVRYQPASLSWPRKSLALVPFLLYVLRQVTGRERSLARSQTRGQRSGVLAHVLHLCRS